MSIAQHSVAGEGVVHLSAIDESAALEYTCDATNLPWVIFRATYRAARIPGLPRRACDLLAALARTVDRAEPFGRIFITRSRLMERARQSMRTLYRSLDDLEAAGFIKRGNQGRTDDYRYDRAYLYLTEAAASLLGLTSDLPKVEPSSDAAPSPAEGQPSAKLAGRSIYEYLSPASQKRQSAGQPPADLQRLRTLGFHDFLIFKLMTLAKKHGKLLSDVVEATWEHLRKANRPICYLTKLLRRDLDFGAIARSRQADRDKLASDRQLDARLTEALTSAAGNTYTDSAGSVQIRVNVDATSVVLVRKEEGIPRTLPAGQMKIFAGEILAGRLRRATPEDLLNFDGGNARRVTPDERESCIAAMRNALRQVSPRAAKD